MRWVLAPSGLALEGEEQFLAALEAGGRGGLLEDALLADVFS